MLVVSLGYFNVGRQVREIMRRKLLIWSTALTFGLTSAVLIGGGVSEAKTSADFSDLKDLDAATKAKFDAMISAGIFDGVSETNFGLKEEMNRAQFAKVAALIFNLEVNRDLKTSSFSDVSSDDPGNGYALPYIEAIKAAGITDGVGNGEYNPASTVTKEQLATFMIRGLGQGAGAMSAPGVSDNTVSDWAKGYVQLALQLQLLNNSSDGTFGGKAEASRELLATGSFESARTFETTMPLLVSGAEFTTGNKLELTMTIGVDPNSIDLSKIMVNGVPLDPKLDSYVLSEDKKTIIIRLHEGFKLDTSKTPVIVVNALKTLFGNEVKNEESKPIPVKVSEPPVTAQLVTYMPSTSLSTPTPAPTPAPTPTPTPAPTPAPTPTATPTPTPAATPTPTPAATPAPTPTATPEPTPTATPVPDVTLTIDVVNGIITQTTASYPVTGSVTGTVYYAVLPSDSTVPSLDGIKLGVDAIVYGSVELDGTKAELILSGLTESTSYVLYAYELANDKTSEISSVSFQTLAEQQVVPMISFNASGTSRGMEINSDTINASVNSEGIDTLYYVLTENASSDSPSVAQVISGQDASGELALQYGTIDKALNGFHISISDNLLTNKTYRLYVVGTKGTLDSEVAGYTFYRTDSMIDTFTSLGTPIVNADSITVSPNYSGSKYYLYYLTTDQYAGINPPSADYIINQGGLGTYNSENGTVSIEGSFTTNTGLYAVIVVYDQTFGDYIRSNVVTYISIP